MAPVPRPAIDRFFDKVSMEPMSGCWLWTGAFGPNGYANFHLRDPRRQLLVHRFAYEALVGAIPAGLVIDHLCNTEECVNPDHLKACTQRVNVLRSNGVAAINARKTSCDRGHLLSGRNLQTSKQGLNRRAVRRCAQCHREQQLAYVRRTKERQ